MFCLLHLNLIMVEFPPLFLNSISNCCGFDQDSFTKVHQTESPTSIRVNPLKKAELNFDLFEPVTWNANGYYLHERPNFTNDLFFQAGCYYVQEAGSMFIEHVLKQCVNFDKELFAFDVCAAPGGKSTLLNSLLNNSSVLISNEVSKPRVEVLSQNITKWGTCNTVVTNNDPSAFAEIQNTFDIILIDAPCSGSGLFRKQHDAVDQWSIDNVNLCAQRQKRILGDVIQSLADDGILIYSTCSYSEQENEEIADWVLSEFNLETIKIRVDESWGIVETIGSAGKSYGYRFYPNKTKSEGFYCTAFKKATTSSDTRLFKKLKHQNFTEIKESEKNLFLNWIDHLESHSIIKFKDDYLLTNAASVNFINKYTHLYLKKVGTAIGSVIKNDVIPNHSLALSIHKNSGINTYECSYEEAILFMKKENFKLNCANGWILLTYKDFGLGWVKQLGNRFNNYLPNECRILK